MSAELLQMALNALEYHQDQTRPISRTTDAINTLRADLEEPTAQASTEPVAWRYRRPSFSGKTWFVTNDPALMRTMKAHMGIEVEALVPEASAAPVVPADTDLLNWLNEQIVDVVYLDDGRIIDVRGYDVRAAIDAARAAAPRELTT